MNKYTIAVLQRIPANSYEEALEIAEQYNAQLENSEPKFDNSGIQYRVVHSYEHDNEGQRVLYLEREDGGGGETEDVPDNG